MVRCKYPVLLTAIVLIGIVGTVACSGIEFRRDQAAKKPESRVEQLESPNDAAAPENSAEMVDPIILQTESNTANSSEDREKKPTPQERTVGRNSALTSAIASLSGVRGAVVVTFGSSALVGIQLQEIEVDRDQWSELVHAVENELQSRDLYLEKVFVTQEPSQYRELQEIAELIQQGTPVARLRERIEKLMKSM